MSSAAELSHEIDSAFMRGYYKRYHGGPRPKGDAAITKIERAGWDAHSAGKGCLEALEEYLRGPFNE